METFTLAFHVDVNSLLDLITAKVYQDKALFLRELISNGFGALDKVRFASLTDPSVLDSGEEFYVRIVLNKEHKVISIRDTGVGMTKADMVNELGTILYYDAQGLMEALSAGGDISTIGGLNLGFHSAYLVAERIQVISKHNDDEQYIWESTGGCTFAITTDVVNLPLGRGTEIRLYLKENQWEYLEEIKIKDIVKKHLEFTSYPIQLVVVENDVEDDEFVTREDYKRSKNIRAQETSYVTINKKRPILARNPSDVTAREYGALYKWLSNDWDEYLAVKHFAVEGMVELKAIVFIPKRSPFDPLKTEKWNGNIRLYVRGTFIADHWDILPNYLRFISGVVDAEDLPLNVSREAIQHNRIVSVIRKKIVKEILEIFSEIAKDKDKFWTFYDAFSKNLKLGIYEDVQNRTKLAEFLRFYSNKSTQEKLSLRDYTIRMPDGQKSIYYFPGESLAAICNSPCLEVLKKNGFEILLLTDPIDEYAITHLGEFDGRELVCTSKEGVTVEGVENEKPLEDETAAAQFSDLCTTIKDVLGDKVEHVITSSRLTDSPCVIVTGQDGWSSNMERLAKAQIFCDLRITSESGLKAILEINPSNDIVKKLRRKVV